MAKDIVTVRIQQAYFQYGQLTMSNGAVLNMQTDDIQPAVGALKALGFEEGEPDHPHPMPQMR